MKEYLEKGDELSAWKEGIVEGRRLAANLGMKPENVNLELVPPYDDIPVTELWFFNPLADFATVVTEDDQDESDDEDLETIETNEMADVDFNVEGTMT